MSSSSAQASSAPTTLAEPTTTTVLPPVREESTLATVSAPLATVEVIPPDALTSKANSMLEMLRRADNGEHLVAEAQKLAAATKIDDLSPLLNYSETARAAMNAISDQIIGDATVGGSGTIGALFSSLENDKKKLDIEALKKEPGLIGKYLLGKDFSGWFGNFISSMCDPVVKFIERYKKLKPQIDKKEALLKTEEAARVTAKNQLTALKGTVIDGFRTVEVSIAAGELALEREHTAFNAALDTFNKTGDKQDIVALTRLRDWRTAILSLDNRLMRLQGFRFDSASSIPLVDDAVRSEEELKNSLEDIRTIIITSMRKWVALGVSAHRRKKAADFASSVADSARSARQATIGLQGEAQEAMATLNTKAAGAAQDMVEDMEKFIKLLQRGNELMKQNEEKNRLAREQLKAAETKFTTDLLGALNSLTEARVG